MIKEDSIEKKRTLRWELGGIAFIVILGTLLHFAFDWSGRCIPGGRDCRRERKCLGTSEVGILASIGICGLGIQPLREVGEQFPLCQDPGNSSDTNHYCGALLFLHSYPGAWPPDGGYCDFRRGGRSRAISEL